MAHVKSLAEYEPKHLELWTMPRNYAGEVWPGFYSAGVGQSRDSDALERANFDAMVKALGGESDTVVVVRESHWAVGWVEWIAIHQDDGQALEIADQIKGKLEDYPIVDEELFSQYEDEECNQVWSECYDVKDRIRYFRRHGFTSTGLGDLLKAIKGGDWGYAANMLHCPSDLLS